MVEQPTTALVGYCVVVKKSDTSHFVLKAKEIHGDLYDYSYVNYINAKTKVLIVCITHGDFNQTPNSHLRGQGCPKCGVNKTNIAENERCKKVFIERARIIHGDTYDYSLTNYVKRFEKVKIICPVHGVFEQTPDCHLRGSGCGMCKGFFIHKAKKHNEYDFIKKARIKHGNDYNYSKVEYYNARTKVEIICPIHGSFWQAPHLHTRGEGCPICMTSQGERKIARILENNGLYYEKQKKFDSCKVIHHLRFDFYLPQYNILIEYQGEQHYSPDSFGMSLDKFFNLKRNDEFKKIWATQNGYLLIEFTYRDKLNYIHKTIKEMQKFIK